MSSMIRPIDKNYRKKLLIKADSEDAVLAELLGSKFDHQVVKLSRHYFLAQLLTHLDYDHDHEAEDVVWTGSPPHSERASGLRKLTRSCLLPPFLSPSWPPRQASTIGWRCCKMKVLPARRFGRAPQLLQTSTCFYVFSCLVLWGLQRDPIHAYLKLMFSTLYIVTSSR